MVTKKIDPYLTDQYSTRTQTHPRWGFALGQSPNASDFFDANMLVSKKPHIPNTSPNQPNASPNQPNMSPTSPNVSHWNMVHIGYARVGFTLGKWVSGCLSPFCSCWVPNANAVSSGIWASQTILFLSE